MEILGDLSVDGDQIRMLEMHSVINVFTVISSQLQLIQLSSGFPEILQPSVDATQEFADSAKYQSDEKLSDTSIDQYRQLVFSCLKRLSKKQPVLDDGTPVSDYLAILENIFPVAAVRIKEFQKRLHSPDNWELFTVDEFRTDFKSFFHALEKNSNGRYRIIYNIDEQEEKDYLVQFDVAGDPGNTIRMPLLLKDVIRDLIANARKYTPPGGKISAGISCKNGIFKFVVEDNGYGIPKDELSKIMEFGYRGSNVKETIKTMGGGFGLTKAWYITKKFNGRMWIESELNRGTKIRIEIPMS